MELVPVRGLVQWGVAKDMALLLFLRILLAMHSLHSGNNTACLLLPAVQHRTLFPRFLLGVLDKCLLMGMVGCVLLSDTAWVVVLFLAWRYISAVLRGL